MVLAHNFPLSTYDIDGVPLNASFQSIDGFVKKVARELSIPGDWLNPWFSSFTHNLPQDYMSRTIEVLKTKKLQVVALGKEDLLIMKCFAHRQKDAASALDFLDDVRDQIE